MSYIDEYGIDHENFTIRDELEYQMKRKNEKEQNKVKYAQIKHNIADIGDALEAGINGFNEGIVGVGKNIYNTAYDLLYGGYKYLTDGNINAYMPRSSFGKVLPLSNKLLLEPVSDINKHQYVSCVGARDGLIPAATTLGAGIIKEGNDIRKKLFNPQQRKAYGGVLGVLKDSYKDLKNDVYGIYRGVTADSDDSCKLLLPEGIRNKY